MKAAAVGMAVLVAVLAALCAHRGGTALVTQGLRAGGTSALKLVPVLAVVFLLTGFVEVLLPREVVARWLSDGSGWRGIAVAWVAGVLTPGGGPVGLPLAAALQRAGAGVGVLVTYLTSMALLSFVRVPMEVGAYGSRLTAIRVAASVALPPLAGMLAQFAARVG